MLEEFSSNEQSIKVLVELKEISKNLNEIKEKMGKGRLS